MTKRTILTALVLWTIFFGVMAWVQFSTPDMPDNDGYYHIRLAELMRTQSLKPDFPWLPLTILNPREFYDHHFLFHVALIPFTFGDLRLGAKWASVTFASLAFLSIWWLLRGRKVPYAALWALGVLVVSQAFLFRMNITRAQSLSLAVLALGLHWMFSGRPKLLLPLAFAYVWMYDAFPLLVAAALVYLLATWLVERRVELQPLVYAAVGTALGLIINPYFPINLVFIYRHLLPKLVETTAVRVGNEWYPYTTLQIVENSGLALLAFLSGALALGLRGEKMDRYTAMLLLLAGIFGAMTFQARRFIEYLAPFALLFAAFAWTPLIQAPRPFAWNRAAMRSWLPGLVLTLFLALGAWHTLPAARESVRSAKPYDLYAQAAAWLQDHTPPGERVFQTDWDDFPRLFFYNLHNTYLIGLDPTYLQLYHPERFQQWLEITQGKVEKPSRSISVDFGANYVFSDLHHTDFIEHAQNDPEMEEVYRDDQAVIYYIR